MSTGPTSAPEVTVVIPSRDRSQLLRHTLRSVADQHGVRAEVIVVDDGSATPLADLPGGIVVLRNDAPTGVAAARNRGIEAARSEWVALLDDDDLWAPGKLRSQLDAARASGARWAYSDALVVDDAGLVVRTDRGPDGADLLLVLLSENLVPAGASNVLAHRDLLGEAGGFDTSMAHFADWDLWLRLAAAATPAHVPSADVAYVLHETNMHRLEIESARKELLRLAARARAATGRAFDPAPAEAWIAEGYARAGRRGRAAAALLHTGIRRRSPRIAAKGVEQLGIGARILPDRRRGTTPAPPWAHPDAGPQASRR